MEVDEERTTLDEGEPRHAKAAAEWEDGTTVEESTLAQGKAYRDANNPFRPEVAGNTTNTTSTNGQTLDELTVEEHARPLPPLQLVPAAQPAQVAESTAKLIVVAGTDTGREFDVIAGKPISIGRAVDNDVVLTDISVSRKHFELLYDAERWILRDRGSGNGTLINDRMEDATCQLYHGDRIEIGNTAFRFDHPASMMKASPVGWGQRDDEEARTIAGKPPASRDEVMNPLDGPIARPVSTLPGTPGSPRRESNRSVPPVVSRARTHTGPSGGIAPGGATPGLQPHPPGMVPGATPNAVTIGPGHQPQAYPVMLAPPNAPTMAPFLAQNPLAPDPMRMGVSQPVISEYPSASPAELAAVGRYPSGQQASRQSVPPQQMAAPMMVVPESRPRGRWAVIGGVAIVVASIGITAAALGGSAASTAKTPITAPKLPKGLKLAKGDATTPTPTPAAGPAIPTPTPNPTPTPTPANGSATVPTPTPTPANGSATVPTPTPTPTPTTNTTTNPTTTDAAKLAEQEAATKKAQQEQAERDAAAKKLADDQARKAEQDAAAKKAADDLAAKKLADDQANANKVSAADARKLEAQRKADEKRERQAKAEEEKRRKAEAKRQAKLDAEERRRKAREKAREDQASEDTGSSGGSSGGGNADAALAKASDQYQSGDFRAAAATLDAAAKNADGGAVDDLRSKAADYRKIQSGLTAGQTEASTKAIDTLAKLKGALAADKRQGGVHQSKISDLIGATAPRAAISHMTKNSYEAAFAATNDAINHGAGGNGNVKNIRKTLESKAGELYSSGSKLISSDPSAGRSQLQRILKMVPSDSPWYARAKKALDAAGKSG